MQIEPFRPTHTCPVELPSGRSIELPHCRTSFPKWCGKETPSFDFGGKAFLDFEGTPVFAEAFILRRLKAAGWEGVWVSSFGGIKFLADMPDDRTLASAIGNIPSDKEALLRAIRQRAGCRGGCFDIFVWRGPETLFCEAKRRSRDRLRDTQRRWIDAALGHDVALSSLLVVEWDYQAISA